MAQHLLVNAVQMSTMTYSHIVTISTSPIHPLPSFLSSYHAAPFSSSGNVGEPLMKKSTYGESRERRPSANGVRRRAVRRQCTFTNGFWVRKYRLPPPLGYIFPNSLLGYFWFRALTWEPAGWVGRVGAEKQRL